MVNVSYYYYSPKIAVPSSGWLIRVANQSAEKETVGCCACVRGSACSLNDLTLTPIGRCDRLRMRHLLSREFVHGHYAPDASVSMGIPASQMKAIQ